MRINKIVKNKQPGLKKSGIRGINDTRQIVGGKTNYMEKTWPYRLGIDSTIRQFMLNRDGHILTSMIWYSTFNWRNMWFWYLTCSGSKSKWQNMINGQEMWYSCSHITLTQLPQKCAGQLSLYKNSDASPNKTSHHFKPLIDSSCLGWDGTIEMHFILHLVSHFSYKRFRTS